MPKYLMKSLMMLAGAVALQYPSHLSAQIIPLSTQGGAVTPPRGAGAKSDSAVAPVNCSESSSQVRRYFRFWRVSNNLRQAKSYFASSGRDYASTSALSVTEKAATIYSEAVSDFMPLPLRLGYGRIGMGFAAAAQNEAAADEKPAGEATAEKPQVKELQQLLGSAGNALAYLAVPLVHYESTARTCANSRVDLLFAPRIGTFIPALGGSANGTGLLTDLGWEVQMVSITVSQQFRFFGVARAGRFAGLNDSTASGLSLGKQRHFWYSRAEVGVELGGRVRVSATRFPAGPSELMKAPTQVQVQLIQGTGKTPR